MNNLPTEVILIIINNLSLLDLNTTRQVNSRLWDIIDDENFYNLYDTTNTRCIYPLKKLGFSEFFLWYHKYVVYRNNRLTFKDDSIYSITMYKMYEYLEELSKHDYSINYYIQNISELLIGFDISSHQCDNDVDTFWELIYGYIMLQCKKKYIDIKCVDDFKKKYHIRSCIIVKYHNI